MTMHNHLTLSSVTLRSSTSNPFTCSSHSIKNLSTYITTSASVRTPLQQSALNTFYTYERLSIFTIGNYSPFSDAEIVIAYFHLFDLLFFFSSLKDRCQVALVSKAGEGLSNFTIKVVALPTGEICSKISIHILEDFQKNERKERLRAYLGILLHEMIHVFLLAYSCRSSEHCAHLLFGRGKLGHGGFNVEAWQSIAFAWQTIAFSVEIVSKRLLHLDIDLMRKWSLVTELCLSGEPIEDIKLERWGFEAEEIAELVSKFGMRVRREARMGLELLQWTKTWSHWLKDVEKGEEPKPDSN